MHKHLAKILFGAAVVMPALGGARFAPASGTPIGDWYERLEKPPFNPPNAAFGPVWTALYAAIATSGYRVYRSIPSGARSRALRLWFLQLTVNGAWSPIFFGARSPTLALGDLILLLPLLEAYRREAARVDRNAARLFVPYIAWALFAGALNFEIVRRNAGREG